MEYRDYLSAQVSAEGSALTFFLAEWRDTDSLQGITRLNDFSSKFEPDFLYRETHVCFPLLTFGAVASRHCVKPEINGPLFDVNLDKSEEGKQGWGNSGQRVSTRSYIKRIRPGRLDILTRTYLPRTVEQTRTSVKESHLV